MLLVVAESSGSSPGRQGYKMAVGADGELTGSIGGGVMEVNLVEQSRSILSEPPALAGGQLRDAAQRTDETSNAHISEQIHRKNAPNSSGMICSGKQTVIFKLLTHQDTNTIESMIGALHNRQHQTLFITPKELSLRPGESGTSDFNFEKLTGDNFIYEEKVGYKNDLYIIGGGHCALALSELMSKMDFHISIFDDRPGLNTIEKNRFAHAINMIEGYDKIVEEIQSGMNAYVVVMTLGYAFDKIVIQNLVDKDFRYFGILGSKAKMATLMKELKSEGFPADKLDRIHAPIGLPINSRTPEEIAISIAAEIISVKNREPQ